MGTCGATCGITKERGRDLEGARATAHRVLAGFVCPRPAPYDALVQLGAKLETLLPVRVLVRAGSQGECDSLYILAGLHRPSLVEIVDEVVPVPAGREALPARETYVRVAISPYDRFAVLTEVVLSCEVEEDGLIVETEPQAGVVDRRLQHIIKGLQGALRKEGLIVLDLAAMLVPLVVPGAPELDEPASLWSVLFERLSPLSPEVAWLPTRSVA